MRFLINIWAISDSPEPQQLKPLLETLQRKRLTEMIHFFDLNNLTFTVCQTNQKYATIKMTSIFHLLI